MTDYNSDPPTPSDVLIAVGERARQLRLLRDLTQEDLARRSGVGTATLYRFEKTGRLSLENALRIAVALGAEDAFQHLFALPKYTSLDEALARPATVRRKRARRRP